MTIKKIGVFIGTIGLITALIVGCGSSSSNYVENNNTDNNDTEIVEGSMAGNTFSLILKGLANGMGSKAGGVIMGDLLDLLGWGNSSDSGEEQTLKNITDMLTAISSELITIESTLEKILNQMDIDVHELKKDINWPRDAITAITSAHQDLNASAYYYDKNGILTRYKPGQVKHTTLQDLATRFINTDQLELQVTSIYEAIKGNDTPLLNNYVGEALDKLTYNDDKLYLAYEGLENLTTELLNNQIMGVNEVIEAKKILYPHSSNAEVYLNVTYIPMLSEEIDNLDNQFSFIYNAVNLVLEDAPIYDPFLPPSAETIFKQAEFYRLLMTGTDDKKFGLRIFHISTADMEKSPDQLSVSQDGSKFYDCNSSRHIVKGRAYDYWEDDTSDTFKVSTDYNVVEYNCGSVPNGEGYEIYPSDDYSKVIGKANVSQYDTNYDLNSSGTISYGFGLITHNIPNRFTEKSDKWTIQKPSKDNYNSSTSGGANEWPIKAYAYNKKDGYESKARIELDGHFYYDGDADERTIYVAYHAKFYTKADAPFSNSTGGGDAYSYYYVGVYDQTDGTYASSDCTNKTYYRLHASSTHSYSSHHDVHNHCSFTAKPGHHYYVYFKMIAKECCNPNTVGESELDTVYRVYIMPTY